MDLFYAPSSSYFGLEAFKATYTEKLLICYSNFDDSLKKLNSRREPVGFLQDNLELNLELHKTNVEFGLCGIRMCMIWKADVSSVSPLSERKTKG